jgi:asparagine synthase (glutamine-hydrolysing)
MCGIFGIFSGPNRLPSQQNLRAALATLSHRGPDADGLFWRPEYGLALGHTRLSIIDPNPRSDQPFKAKFCTLIFNGEIYNYRELREQLRSEGAVFNTSGDSEVIVRGYEHWGSAVFDRLLGMYAIALFDERQHSLHLTRDQFGIKPLCFLQRNDDVVFASEVKAIAALHSLSIDGGVLADMLSWGFQLENNSLYSGVSYLAPGTLMTLSRAHSGELQISKRSCEFADSAEAKFPAEQGIKSLRSTIISSVESHLIADVPIAIALSGGLDSSIVAAAAAKNHPGLHAYTFTLGGDKDPEVEHAKLLCRHLGLKHRVARLVTGNMEGWLRRVAFHLEEPVANINALLSFGLAALVRTDNFKVVLVGEGADELFGGYPWYRFALDSALATNPSALFNAYHRRRAHLNFNRILRSETQQLAQEQLARQRAAFAQHLALTPHSALDGFLSFDQATQLQYSQLLRVDRMFMAHGVEARVPFLYRPVLRASQSLTAAEKLRTAEIHRREEKIALAEAFADDLPQAILARPKFGETGTVNIWNTWLANSLTSEFDRCLSSEELRGARQLLDEHIDWRRVLQTQLAPKEKFALSLMVEAVDTLLLSRRRHDETLPVQWEFVN